MKTSNTLTFEIRRLFNQGKSIKEIAETLEVDTRTVRWRQSRMNDEEKHGKDYDEAAVTFNAHWLYNMDIISCTRIAQYFGMSREHISSILAGTVRPEMFDIAQSVMRSQCRIKQYDQFGYMAECMEQVGLPVEQEKAA